MQATPQAGTSSLTVVQESIFHFLYQFESELKGGFTGRGSRDIEAGYAFQCVQLSSCRLYKF